MTKITKYFAVATLSVVAVVSVGVARPAEAAALTASQIQAVVSLLQAFGVESSTITTVEQTLSGAQTSTSTSAVSPDIIGFFRFGNEGDGIKLLQLILAADSSVYPEGIVSGYFGQLTERALKRFQRKHGLEQVGFVGPQTLQRLRAAFAENPISQEHGGKFCVPPGHLIAPGWLKRHGNNGLDILTCTNLPPGIAKKISTTSGSTTTPPVADTTAPTISEVEVDSIEATSAEVEWKTSEDATSKVYYGTSTPLGLGSASSVSSSTLRNSHSLELSGLATSTIYYYVVESKDAANNTATSSEASFTTASS